MKIFENGYLRDHLASLMNGMSMEVQAEEKNRLLNVNEVEYIDYLAKKFSLEPIKLHRDQVSVSDREEMVDIGNQFSDYNYRQVRRIKTKKQIIQYHLPYCGDKQLFHFLPSQHILWTMQFTINDYEIAFDVVNLNDNVEAVKIEASTILDRLSTQIENVANEVQYYNSQLRSKAQEVVVNRKKELLRQSNLLMNLGVPFKKKDQIQDTFAIPVVRKKPIIRKPESSSVPYVSEPALDPQTYKEILKICHQAGIEIERHPNIYQGKDEETLRDHFLMILSPHFESVTGETFNNKGKTDILIRHEGKNVFVAECKFWKGEKVHHETIDQLLGYLTWRDSKSAVLYFISNKQLDSVLEQIEKKTQEHPCFIRYEGNLATGWYSFQFHLPNDQTRGVSLSILCFHFSDKS